MRLRVPMVRRATYAVLAALASCLVAAPAWSDVRDVPVKVRMLPLDTPPTARQPLTAEIEIVVARPVRIDQLSVKGAGWAVRFLNPQTSRSAEPSQAVHLRFVATPTHPDVPLTLRFNYDGEPFETTIDLSAAATPRTPGATELAPTQPAADEFPGVDRSLPHPDPAPAREPMRTLEEAEPRSDIDPRLIVSTRYIRVYGRFGFERPAFGAIPAVYVGADSVTVRVKNDNYPLFDTQLASGVTDRFGYYDFNIAWTDCLVCENPDIYVEFESANGHVVVQTADILEQEYVWTTPITEDYTGTSVYMGVRQPSGSGGAVSIFTNTMRTWRWLNAHEGYDTPTVDVQWPATIHSFYNPFFEEIHIEGGDEWEETTAAHEYGHHWIKQFATFVLPVYCIPPNHCDNPCGHCPWCSETTDIAWTEGWPTWFSDVVTRSFAGEYGLASTRTEPTENTQRCSQDNSLDPLQTEGVLAALLRDIEDGETENDTDQNFTGVDQLALGTHPIFQVADLDAPTTPTGFINAFRARYPGHREAFCKTAKNNGYQIADVAPPGNVTAIENVPIMTNGCTAIPFLYLTRNKLVWTRASDDCAGVVGYSVLLSTTQAMPDTTMDIGDVLTYQSCEHIGYKYFNIRALDGAGRWSETFVSIPIVESSLSTPVPTFGSTAGLLAAIVSFLVLGTLLRLRATARRQQEAAATRE